MIHPVAPCRRACWPVRKPLVDLTQDLTLAKGVLDAVQPFFWFAPGEARFSGYVRKTDRTDGSPGSHGPCFYVQLWAGERLYRTVAFQNTGYQGILHVDLGAMSPRVFTWTEDDPVSQVAGFVYQLYECVDGFETEQIWYVQKGALQGKIPWNHPLR